MTSRKAQLLSLIFAAILLISQFGLQLYLARADSQTTDEAIHLYAGYRYLTHGDFSYNPEHPPLVKYMAAFPLLFMHINEPPLYADYAKKTDDFFFWGDTEQSKVAEDFLFNSGNDPVKTLFWGRVPMALLTMLLGILLYIVGAYYFGWWGGLLAVALYAFDPTVNGHGHLVTTDIGSAFGVLLSLFAFLLFLKDQSWKKAIWFGAATGIALLMKFSTLLLGPTFAVLVIYYLFTQRTNLSWKMFGFFVLKLAVSVAAAWFILLAGYQFQLQPAPHEDSVVKAAQQANYLQQPWLPDTPLINGSYNIVRHILIPSDYLRGLISFTNHATSGHPSYLFGKSSETGWKYYFPVLFSAKVFIPVLLLLLISIYGAIRYRKEQPIAVYLLISFFAYFAFSTLSKVNIGIRHIMPVFPLAFLLIGALATYPFPYRRHFKMLIAICMTLVVLEFISIFPFYLSYFNQFYGGSYNGYKVADDSNLDWGQDLYRIQNYIKDNKIDHVYLEYNWEGESSLRYFHLPYQQLTSFDRNKDHGFIIICATSLIQPTFNWLLAYPIYHQIAPGVFVYKL